MPNQFPPVLMPPYNYPSMYVPTGLLLDRRQYFISNKQKRIKYAGVSVPSYLFFSKQEFIDMLYYFSVTRKADGFTMLRLLFAVDDDNVMTIIFAPAWDKAKEKEYYFLNPDNKNNFESLDSLTANKWIVDNYQGKFLQSLKGTFDPDPEKSPTDTVSVDYEITYLIEIASEMGYQAAINNVNISTIRILFSSYTDKDITHDKIITKRFITQFVLTQSLGSEEEVFFIDTMGDWLGRKPSTEKLKMPNFDTGNLCPPRCS